ncbi:MAG TPA: phasin family protein [Gemmatimonadaceae bacterium]|nr:phasin family protein [Gemmatimonadaceae bacterium]
MAKKTAVTKRVGPRIQESAQNIWRAGLGAFALAEEEGSKLFTALVKKGTSFETKNRARLGKVVADVEGTVEVVRDRTIGKVGSTVETRMAGVLHRLNIPTHGEIKHLTSRVDNLTKAIDKRPARTRRVARKRASAPPA